MQNDVATAPAKWFNTSVRLQHHGIATKCRSATEIVALANKWERRVTCAKLRVSTSGVSFNLMMAASAAGRATLSALSSAASKPSNSARGMAAIVLPSVVALPHTPHAPH